MQRYLRTVRQNNRGVVDGGNDTDMGQDEGHESGVPTDDPHISLAALRSDFDQVLETFRNEANDALRREQRSLLRILGVPNVHNPVPRDIKQQLFLKLGDDMYGLGQKNQRGDGRMAGKYFEYAQQLREMAYL
eukprot:s4681_g2.t1